MKDFLRQNFIWIIFLLLISAGSVSGELINGRFSMPDLEVYYKTAERMMGGEEIYDVTVDNSSYHYVYKYSPPAAISFIPLTIFSFSFSKFLYWIFLTFLFGATLYNIKVIFLGKGKSNSRITGSLILATAIVGTHFFRELHLGQVNLVMLAIYILALRFFLSEKYAAMGVLLAFSIFIKPFALIFIPFLLLVRAYKGLMYYALFAILFFLTPLLFYHNYSDFIALYGSWIEELAKELGNKQSLITDGNHTIFSVLARYSPIRMLEMSDTSRYIYQLIIIGMIGGLILWTYTKRKVADAPARIYIILIAIIPLLAFTSYNAFIFTLPLLTYLMFKFRELGLIFKIIFIISCLLIGANIYDLVGRDLFDFFWAISVYSWGTMGLLAIIFTNWRKFSVGRGA